VTAPRQLRPEGDRGKGVTGVAERRKQDAATAQSISASARIVAVRCSGSNAMGETISVPTPASR
jgi:hypothetical protein